MFVIVQLSCIRKCHHTIPNHKIRKAHLCGQTEPNICDIPPGPSHSSPCVLRLFWSLIFNPIFTDMCGQYMTLEFKS